MNEERTRQCLRQVEHIRGHLQLKQQIYAWQLLLFTYIVLPFVWYNYILDQHEETFAIVILIYIYQIGNQNTSTLSAPMFYGYNSMW